MHPRSASSVPAAVLALAVVATVAGGIVLAGPTTASSAAGSVSGVGPSSVAAGSDAAVGPPSVATGSVSGVGPSSVAAGSAAAVGSPSVAAGSAAAVGSPSTVGSPVATRSPSGTAPVAPADRVADGRTDSATRATTAINGVVTTDDNDPVPRALVYARTIEFPDGSALHLDPVADSYEDGQPTRIRVTYDLSGRSEVYRTGELIAGIPFEAFPRLNDSSGDGITLAARTAGLDADNPGVYTLDRAAALEGADDSPDDDLIYRLRAIQRVAGSEESGAVGNGSSVVDRVGFTSEGNVVVDVGSPSLSVTGVVPDPPTVTAGDPLTVTVTVRNDGTLAGAGTVALSMEGVGEVGSRRVSLAVGESTTVRFRVSSVRTASLVGVKRLTATTADSTRIAAVTVTRTAGGGIDVGDDGNRSTDVDGDRLHEDVDGDGDFDTGDVQTLLDDLVTDASAADRPDLFDVDGDGSVGTGDVQALLDDLVD